MADLSIVMGSTLQIIPAGNMPTYTKKYHVRILGKVFQKLFEIFVFLSGHG